MWLDADAAAFVRLVAGDSETVPTVEIAGTAFVRPTARQGPRELNNGSAPRDVPWVVTIDVGSSV